MTTPDALTRLTAALAEDERIARAVAPTPSDWHVDDPDGIGDTVVWWPPDPEVAERERAHGVNVTADRWQGQQFDHEPVASHVARHDPARVLRQAAAIRKVLEEHRRTAYGHCEVCRDYDFHRTYDPVPWPCPTVRALAGIYDTEPTEEPT